MKNKKASKQDAGIPFRAWAQPPMQEVVAECCRMRRPPLDSVYQDEPGAEELKHVDVRRLGKSPRGGNMNPTIGGKGDVASWGELYRPMGYPGSRACSGLTHNDDTALQEWTLRAVGVDSMWCRVVLCRG